MLVVTSDTIPGYDIVAVFGMVTGSVVRGVETILSGPQTVSEVVGASRREAIGWMMADARQRRANAIIGTRLDTSQNTLGIEYSAYGTAVWAMPSTEDARRLYEVMVHEGRVPPLSQYQVLIRGIDSLID